MIMYQTEVWSPVKDITEYTTMCDIVSVSTPIDTDCTSSLNVPELIDKFINVFCPLNYGPTVRNKFTNELNMCTNELMNDKHKYIIKFTKYYVAKDNHSAFRPKSTESGYDYEVLEMCIRELEEPKEPENFSSISKL